MLFIVIPSGLWLFTQKSVLREDTVMRHLSSPQRLANQMEEDTNVSVDKRNQQWFDQFSNRIEAIPDEGPVVFVAATGGGSRAAIFAALTLETLQRTPISSDQWIYAEFKLSN
jgi:hypothetical protein